MSKIGDVYDSSGKHIGTVEDDLPEDPSGCLGPAIIVGLIILGGVLIWFYFFVCFFDANLDLSERVWAFLILGQVVLFNYLTYQIEKDRKDEKDPFRETYSMGVFLVTFGGGCLSG